MTNVDKALLLAEWSCQAGACPVCRDSVTHQVGCAMDLALSERGYCVREERDRARAFTAQYAPTLPPTVRTHGDAGSSDPNFDADPDDGA